MATKEELEDQLEVARKDVEALAVMAGDTAREQVRNGADHAKAQAAQLSDEARNLYDAARNEGAKLREKTEDQVRTHPLGTIGIAFAAGLVTAGLLKRQ